MKNSRVGLNTFLYIFTTELYKVFALQNLFNLITEFLFGVDKFSKSRGNGQANHNIKNKVCAIFHLFFSIPYCNFFLQT